MYYFKIVDNFISQFCSVNYMYNYTINRMLARFELFNDQSFNQNNRQDLNAVTSAIFFKPWCLVLAQLSSIYLFNLSNFRHALPKWHKTNATIRGILTALYTLKFTRDPLINRLLLCKNPIILQWDFQLYTYNIDVMEK